MIGLIMVLFGFSSMGQFTLEMPEYLPLPSNVICEEMTEANFDPNCQHEDYSIFRFWCNGNRCDDHGVKGYAKEIASDGTITWYTTQEQVYLDINSLEPWQIIRYTTEELREKNIIPEDCTVESEQNGTCGYGLFPQNP